MTTTNVGYWVHAVRIVRAKAFSWRKGYVVREARYDSRGEVNNGGE
jgi:hypothetical protein